jgi:hypothetical protein
MQGMNSSTSLPDAHSGRLVALFAGAKLLLDLGLRVLPGRALLPGLRRPPGRGLRGPPAAQRALAVAVARAPRRLPLRPPADAGAPRCRHGRARRPLGAPDGRRPLGPGARHDGCPGRAAVPGVRALLLDERVRRVLLGAGRLPGAAGAGAADRGALGGPRRRAGAGPAEQDRRALGAPASWSGSWPRANGACWRRPGPGSPVRSRRSSSHRTSRGRSRTAGPRASSSTTPRPRRWRRSRRCSSWSARS